MRTCLHCGGQGRLLILKDSSSGGLYLHCEECEWGWRDPEKTDDIGSAFLTLDEDFDSEVPSRDEIEERGWAKYISGHFDERTVDG
jgi:hypothetical protein